MKYADIYKEARKNDNVQSISSVFKTDWKKGEVVMGRLISITELESPKFNKKYFSYLFNTDEGNIKTSLGAGVDAEVKPFMKYGEIYRVEYKGDKDIGKGKPMKIFDVQHVGAEGEDEDAETQPSEIQEKLPI